MRILITNTVLAGRSGTEIFVAQLADELRRRGHETILYSPLIGSLGHALQRSGHLVFQRVADISTVPDVIHAHHMGPTLTALTAFPKVPIIFVSHSVESEFDAMPYHPRIFRYLAVSDSVRAQRASSRLPMEAIHLLRNAVDLTQFPPGGKRPSKPSTALAIVKQPVDHDIIAQTCKRAGIELTAIGPGLGIVSDRLPQLFAQADVVFASGRSALEALASGCAVILTDGGKFGGLVGQDRIESLLNNNLGAHTMPHSLSEKLLAGALDAYDCDAAGEASAYVREVSSLTDQVDQLLEIYAAAIRQGVPAAGNDLPLAELVEAYVPSYGELPWRDLVRNMVDDATRAKLDFLSFIKRLPIGEDGAHQKSLAETELLAVYQSRSWRVTAWLRWLKRTMCDGWS